MVESLNPKDRKEFWDDKWDKKWDYNLLLKTMGLQPKLAALDADGKIGDVVVDVGSGHMPMTTLLPAKESRKIITVDISGDRTPLLGDTTHVQYDLEKLGKKTYVSGMAALQIADFLNINPRAASPKQVDTMLFSEILNYVDYQNTLSKLARFLKKDGRFIIVNRPSRGITKEFSEKGAKGNQEIVDFLIEKGFEIEETVYAGNEDSNEKNFMLLIARKLEKSENKE